MAPQQTQVVRVGQQRTNDANDDNVMQHFSYKSRFGRLLRFERTYRSTLGLALGLFTAAWAPLATAQLGQYADIDPERYDTIAAQIVQSEAADASIVLDQIIDNLLSQQGRFAPALVEPLGLKGKALLALGDNAGAIDYFDQAIHISRIDQGLFTPQQVALVYQQAEGYRALGDFKEALGREEYAYQILVRNTAASSPDILPGMLRLANSYLDNYNYRAARALFTKGLTLIAAADVDPAVAVAFLSGTAKTHLHERFPAAFSGAGGSINVEFAPSIRQIDLSREYNADAALTNHNYALGKRALQQAVNIRRAQLAALQPAEEAPEVKEVTEVIASKETKVARSAKVIAATPQIVAATAALQKMLLDMADWHTMFASWRQAAAFYNEVFRLQDSLPETEQLDLSQPALLLSPRVILPKPPSFTDRLPQEVGFVRLSLDVQKSGRVRNMVTTEAFPDDKMVFKVRKSTRDAVFRPALANGDTIITPAYDFTYQYPFFPSRAERAAQEKANAEAVMQKDAAAQQEDEAAAQKERPEEAQTAASAEENSDTTEPTTVGPI